MAGQDSGGTEGDGWIRYFWFLNFIKKMLQRRKERQAQAAANRTGES